MYRQGSKYTLAHAERINDTVGRKELANEEIISYKAETIYEFQEYKGRDRCTYCGSLSPNALRDLIKEGAKIELADQKYGWPHKFYITAEKDWGKFYSVHLKDAISSFSYWDIREAISLQTGVHLEVDNLGFIAYYEAAHA